MRDSQGSLSSSRRAGDVASRHLAVRVPPEALVVTLTVSLAVRSDLGHALPACAAAPHPSPDGSGKVFDAHCAPHTTHPHHNKHIDEPQVAYGNSRGDLIPNAASRVVPPRVQKQEGSGNTPPPSPRHPPTGAGPRSGLEGPKQVFSAFRAHFSEKGPHLAPLGHAAHG